ncbi:MAG: hypothetical protein H6724_10075 [Sandaracinus sp.]|nr:hypothetical protein [Myxococcales bacterium]MCB9598971.1 hypothetical protein [Sandaracinus sp.]MCB9619779.1 hypothetical protein [Sandaracinus sp.]
MLGQTQSVAAAVATYTSNARFNTRHCMGLALQLQHAAPADLSHDEKKALDALVARAKEVDEVRKSRARTSPPALRAPRQALLTAWSSLYNALGAFAALPSDGEARAEAAFVQAALFTDGLDFLSLDALALWGQSRMLLERMSEEGLRPRISGLVHAEFLVAIDEAFKTLGDQLGVAGVSAPMAPRRALADAAARFFFAVSSYARALALHLDDTDEVGLARFLTALAPIDRVRITRGGASTDDEDLDEEDADDTDPAPEVGVARDGADPEPMPVSGENDDMIPWGPGHPNYPFTE